MSPAPSHVSGLQRVTSHHILLHLPVPSANYYLQNIKIQSLCSLTARIDIPLYTIEIDSP